MVRLVWSACVALFVVHLLAAIGAIENTCQWVRLTAYPLWSAAGFSKPLNDIPCFLVYNGGVCVFEDYHIFGRGGFPFGFVILFYGLVQNAPAHVFLLFYEIDNGSS